MDEVVEHLGEAVAAFFFYVLGGGGLAGRGRKADRSFRLRLHSGHRQSGSAFGAAFIGVAKATPYQSGPREITPARKTLAGDPDTHPSQQSWPGTLIRGPFRGLVVGAGVRGCAEVRSHISEARCEGTRPFSQRLCHVGDARRTHSRFKSVNRSSVKQW